MKVFRIPRMWTIAFLFQLCCTGGSAGTYVNRTYNDRGTVALCPRQYIDVLAECPNDLECTHNNDCEANDICCNNACGTKTCVSPWVPEGNDEDQSGCVDYACPGQGRQCRIVDRERWCLCLSSCIQVMTNDEIVCDQNGRMYTTQCWLDKQACDSGTTLTPTRCRPIDEVTNVAEGDITPPSFWSVPRVRDAKENTSVTFPCTPRGNPTPAVFWQTKDNGELLAAGASNDRMTVNPSTKSITIRNVQIDDSGEYVCFAVNRGGHATLSYRLRVTAAAPSVQRSERSSRVDCNSFPSEQATRCSSAGSRPIKKLWVYNRNRNVCKRSYFRDCRAVTNKFPTWSDCVRSCVKDICNLPLDVGPCKAFQQRVYYDADRQMCLSFAYGGCEGNHNNFPDMATCQARCESPSANRTSVLRPTCPTCDVNEARAVCNSEFVVVGIVKHFRESRSSQEGSQRTMHIQMTEVLKDISQTLDLRNRLYDPEQSRIEITIDLPEDCPCPDIRLLRQTSSQTSGNSRRNPTGRSANVRAIIAGTTVDGVPTLNSEGFAERYNDESYERMQSTISFGVKICNVMNFVDSKYT